MDEFCLEFCPHKALEPFIQKLWKEWNILSSWKGHNLHEKITICMRRQALIKAMFL